MTDSLSEVIARVQERRAFEHETGLTYGDIAEDAYRLADVCEYYQAILHNLESRIEHAHDVLKDKP